MRVNNHYIIMALWNDIHFRTGDATQPVGEGNKLIVHICNDIGHWGGGFTASVSHHWFKPEIAYHHYHTINDTAEPLELGMIQIVKVEADLWVVNLIGQHGTGGRGQIVPPIRYEAVRKGLERVKRVAERKNASVHMPRIGCGLAGGTWGRIQPLIQNELTSKGIEVTVYDLPAGGGGRVG